MDWILLGLSVIYFFVGMKKGFLSIVFSCVGTFIVVLLSLRFCGVLSNGLNGAFGNIIYSGIKNGVDNVIGGKFSSKEEFLFCLMSTRYGKYFGAILKILLKNVFFDGQLSAGEIVAPTLSELTLKVLSFVLFFILFSIVFKLIEKILKGIFKRLNLKGDRIFGGVIGFGKGLLIFFVFYVVITAFANFTLSENLLKFVQSGNISKQIYNTFIIKIISLFY